MTSLPNPTSPTDRPPLAGRRLSIAKPPPRQYHTVSRSVALAVFALTALTSPAFGADPLNTVRAFCQADGRGDRLDPRTWPRVGDMVSWALEPGWDHVFLIRGFELSAPLRIDGGLSAEVRYTVVGEVGATGAKTTERVETRVLRLGRDEDGVWRIRPPAPPPYVFANEADPAALAALLAPGGEGTYESNSAFVWQLLRSAGWTMPYADTIALATDPNFTTERSSELGDLALYYDGNQPYHVAIVESEESVVSATLNGGIRRTPFGAFAGEIRYRRPVVAAPTPLSAPKEDPQSGGR